MRCKACNTLLDDIESTRKDNQGRYVDLCSVCHNVSLATEWDIELTTRDDIVNLDDVTFLQDYNLLD
jgi:hypothetical protein